MTLQERLAAYSKRVEDRLMTYIQPSEDKGQAIIFEACRYSAMAGGKRLRPGLVNSAASAAAIWKQRFRLPVHWK